VDGRFPGDAAALQGCRARCAAEANTEVNKKRV